LMVCLIAIPSVPAEPWRQRPDSPMDQPTPAER